MLITFCHLLDLSSLSSPVITMSANSRTWSALTIAGITVAGGVLAYAVYFDYKRRNDTEFRKKLRKEKKRVQKAAAAAKPSLNITTEELRAAIAKIRSEEIPDIGPEREAYFMQNVGIGEQLCAQGLASALPAAMSFFRALRVYPSPVELIMIYQKTVPDEIFKLIVEMTNLDAQALASGYYNFFPAKSFNVSVQDQGNKKILVAEKDFDAGDVIYTEEPVVAALDPDLQEAGTNCTHCFRLIHQADAVSSDNDPLHAVYCSAECQAKSKLQSHHCLFLPEPLLPPELDQGQSLNTEARSKGQQAFADYLKETKKTHPMLVARFAARQIATEIGKLTEQVTKQDTSSILDLPNYVEKGGPEYALGDHFERLRYVDAPVPEEETKVIQGVFSNSLPGLDQFLTDERHGIMLSKVAYNAIGVTFSGGRDNRPVFQERPEDQERTRTPYGTNRQVGSGVYIVSAYLGHSCDPSTKPAFKNGTTTLHLVATRPIKKGDELTMSYVDVTQHENETPEEARRRRRFELARGWRFKCECAKCTTEGASAPEGAVEEDLGVEKDESRLEASVERFSSGQVPEQTSASPSAPESETD
ncbi:hypothetical protein BDY19DRAFT_944404 [Irpex rosettiformis]|uniref:Uncharacterized protein n=1 Tax=Irpex rosettiformis TaxID=378272 RepID=A0ACB8U4L2_9APHY|nr:hypothetical protein BDY19DRAFT_944404 [Irpex rosettiformis]